MSASAKNARVFFEDEMEDVVVCPAGDDETARGTVVVFSRHAPDKDSGNEDAAAVVTAGAFGRVLVVADGMGGRPAGEGASRILIDELSARVAEAAGGNTTDLRPAIMDGIENANAKVMAMGVGAGATLAAVEISEVGARSYHVGDAQVVIVGGRGKIKLQTVPHSPVGYGVEAGLIDESDALLHDERHLISNMVGAGDMRIEVGSAHPLAERDTVVVGSDGLFDNLSVAEVAAIVRKGPLDKAGRNLAAVCRERMAGSDPDHPSKPDDLTFILYRGR